MKTRPARMVSRLERCFWISLAWIFTVLGGAGVLVPLLPTTPFFLLALWAAFKGSPRLARKLMRHPRYGPILRAWCRNRSIPRSAKHMAGALLALSWLTLWLLGTRWEVLAFLTLFFTGVAAFVWSRPDTQLRVSAFPLPPNP